MMNKMVRMFVNFSAMLSVVVCISGCSSGESTDSAGASVKKVKINIEDIAWNVDECIVDGDRYVILDYTNNTKYTLTDFEITFKEKADVTEEEKAQFCSDIENAYDISEEDMEEIRSRSISMHAETNRVIDPGESVSNVNCYYYSGSFYLKDISHYNLVEPDIATVKYIDEDKIFTVYYDYGSKKYSAESETETAYQWSQTELSSRIPKPDVKVVESGRDDEKIFMFDAYGLSLEQFNTYIEECKELGYTVEPRSHEGFYSADDADGYNVYLYYNERSYSMDASVSAPEEEKE